MAFRLLRTHRDLAQGALQERLLSTIRLTVEANDMCAALKQRVAFEVSKGTCVGQA